MLSDDRDEPAPRGAVGRLAVDRDDQPADVVRRLRSATPDATAASFTRDGRWYLTGDTAEPGRRRMSPLLRARRRRDRHRWASDRPVRSGECVDAARRRHRGGGGRGADDPPRHGAGGLRGAAAAARSPHSGWRTISGRWCARSSRLTPYRASCTSSTRCRALPGAPSGGLRCASGGPTGEPVLDPTASARPSAHGERDGRRVPHHDPAAGGVPDVGLVVGVESLGVPLPGEIVLVSAALLSSRHELDVSPGGSPSPRRPER